MVIPTIFTAVDKYSSVLSTMQSKTDKFAASAMNVAKKSLLIGGAIAAPLALAANEAIKYQSSLASFRTIVSELNDTEFGKFEGAIKSIGDTTGKSYTEVASSFEKIAGLNAKFAETSEGISQVTNSVITLARASRMDLGSSAENLVGIMNQFSMSATDADKAINILAAGQAVGAASIAQTAESFKNFGSTASNANVSLEESVALIQTLGKFSLFGAEAGTKLRGAISKLQEANVGYASGQFSINDALLEAKAKIDKLSTAKAKDAAISKMFGLENKNAGLILLNNIETYKEYTKGVTGTSEAQKAAAINQATFAERLKDARGKMENLAVVATEKLLPTFEKLVDGAGKFIDKLQAYEKKNPGTLAAIVKIAAALSALAFAIGTVATIVGGIATIGSAAAAVMAKIGASSLWINYAAVAWEVFLAGITAFVEIVAASLGVGFAAAGALIVAVIAVVASAIWSIYENWDFLVAAFRHGGIIEGFKAIGLVILDMILLPMQKIAELIDWIAGTDWGSSIEGFRADLKANVNTVDPTNTRAVEQAAFQEYISTNNAKVAIDINDPNGRTTARSTSDLVQIKMGSTMSFE
jgi:TP901 family phage tail tape measure protein